MCLKRSGFDETRSGEEMEGHNEDNESTLQELIKFLKEYFEVEEKSVEVQKFARDHPLVTIFLTVTIAMCAIPMFIFGLFVFGSILLAIIGFIFVEGTVLAIGTMILGGVLFFVALLALGVSASIAFGYFSVLMAGDIINNVQERVPGLQMSTLGDLGKGVQDKVPFLGSVVRRVRGCIPSLSPGQENESEE